MSIKSTDGKVEMTLSAPESTFKTSLKGNKSLNTDFSVVETSISKAELETIFGGSVDLTNIRSSDKITLYEMTKEN